MGGSISLSFFKFELTNDSNPVVEFASGNWRVQEPSAYEVFSELYLPMAVLPPL